MVEQGAGQRGLQPQEEEGQTSLEAGAVEGGREAKGGPKRSGRRSNNERAWGLGIDRRVNRETGQRGVNRWCERGRRRRCRRG